MPVSSVTAKASAFICATISSMPSRASVTTAVTRPFASKRGARICPSSSACLSVGESANSIGGITGPCLRDRLEPSAPAAVPHHGYKPDLLFWTILEAAGEGGGEGRCPLLFDASHGHAHM